MVGADTCEHLHSNFYELLGHEYSEEIVATSHKLSGSSDWLLKAFLPNGTSPYKPLQITLWVEGLRGHFL